MLFITRGNTLYFSHFAVWYLSKAVASFHFSYTKMGKRNLIHSPAKKVYKIDKDETKPRKIRQKVVKYKKNSGDSLSTDEDPNEVIVIKIFVNTHRGTCQKLTKQLSLVPPKPNGGSPKLVKTEENIEA